MSIAQLRLLRQALAQVTSNPNWLDTSVATLGDFFDRQSPLQAIVEVRQRGLRPEDMDRFLGR